MELAVSGSDLPTCQCPLCQGGADHPDASGIANCCSCSAVWMRTSAAGSWRWSPSGWATAATLFPITGMDEKTRRGQNWTPRWPTTRRNASGEQVAAAHRSKKRPCHNPGLAGGGGAGNGGRPDERAEVGAQQSAPLEPPPGSEGHPASPPTVARLLDKLGYALHVNAKKLEASAQRPDRQAQFEHIAAQKAAFMELEVSGYKIFHGKINEAVP